MVRAYDDNGNVVDLVKWEEEIRADERRKFAEWLVDCLDCNKTFMNAFIKKYEKEKQNDRTGSQK